MNPELARLIAAQIFLHACMTAMRMAAPLWALRQGYSALAVGMLLALFALTQVFLALPAGRYADRHGLRRPMAGAVLAARLSEDAGTSVTLLEAGGEDKSVLIHCPAGLALTEPTARSAADS